MSEGAPSPPSSPGPSSSSQEMGGRGKEEERARVGGKGGKAKDGEKEVVALQVKFYFLAKKHKSQVLFLFNCSSPKNRNEKK